MPRKSRGDYPKDWAEIAARVKAEACWICVRCRHAHCPESGYTLTVHHLDLNAGNNRWWNLAALCQRCHLRIQAKVVMHRPWMFEHADWFKPFVAGYYAYHWGIDDSYEFVLCQIEQLLALGAPV
jgi:5-methylcytosine-specific restriction endonuclease McrA